MTPRGRRSLEERGFLLCREVIDPDRLAALLRLLDEGLPGNLEAGVRRLAQRVPAVAELARSAPLRDLADELGGEPMRLVRSILFDKNATANWPVAWHQDLSIAVREKRAVPGFEPWSVKEGTPHVQPPRAILETLLTLRLHLDRADEQSGALRVIPESHARGVLDLESLRETASDEAARRLDAAPGDVLAMRPLLVHSSRRGTAPSRRRVVHLEYAPAARELPGGLEWAED